MNQAFFNNERELTLVQNNHFDEALDVSQDSDEVSSSDEGDDYSPVKKLIHDSNLSEFNPSPQKQQDDESIQVGEGQSQNENKSHYFIGGGEDVPNTFYDEKFEINDDFSSVETNEEGEGDDDDDMNNQFQHLFTSSQAKTSSSRFSTREKLLVAVPSKANKQTKEEELTRTNQGNSKNISNKNKNNNDYHSQKEDEESQPLSPDLKELFQCINEYKPKVIEIEPTLKCFIPPYIPSIGDIDPFLKVPRPDNIQDGLGLMVVDEPSLKQSDKAVLELQLRAQMKKKMRKNGGGSTMMSQVRSIENASKNQYDIDKWIQSVQDLRISKPIMAEVQYKDQSIIPTFDQLMCPFPKELQDEFTLNPQCTLLDPQIDLSLEEYAKVICTLLDVPVVDGHLIQSLYVLFNLCIEYEKDLHGDAVSIL